MSNMSPVEEIIAKINFAQIDTLINNKQCKLSKLAVDLGISQPELRLAMRHHYGDRIEFKRGRSGGIFWSTVNKG